jgi:trimethylamine--corrinoid protein Co-methyltransferase
MIRSIALDDPIDILSTEEVTRVHEMTLDVLENTGIKLTSPKILKQLGDAGARIDVDEERVWFSPELVEAAIKNTPSTLVMGARNPEQTFVLDGSRGYLGVDGCAAEILDIDTDQKRPSTKKDLGDVTRLGDALDEIGYIWQPVAARDVPVPVQPIHETDAGFRNTTKHVMQMTSVTEDQAKAIIEMATAIVGSPEQLRKEPIISAFQCSISPLVYDGGPVEAAIEYGKAGVPCGFMVMPITCATTPASASGGLVISNTEIIAGIAIMQTLVPGAPTFYGSCLTCLDLRTGQATCGGPEDVFFQMASSQLARQYDIRSIIGTFATGSKIYDWQGGVENAISGMGSTLGGADMYSGAGLLYAARVLSPVEMVLDAESFGIISRFKDGFGDTPEDLAVEVIEAVGPGSHFLGETHTREHFRDFYQSPVFERDPWDVWETKGRPDPTDAAKARARDILDNHEATPLPDDVSKEFDDILARYTDLLVDEEED